MHGFLCFKLERQCRADNRGPANRVVLVGRWRAADACGNGATPGVFLAEGCSTSKSCLLRAFFIAASAHS